MPDEYYLYSLGVCIFEVSRTSFRLFTKYSCAASCERSRTSSLGADNENFETTKVNLEHYI